MPEMTERKILLAMRLVVEWQKLRSFCEGRTHCVGCPYNNSKLCATTTDSAILQKSADTFREYLLAKGVDA